MAGNLIRGRDFQTATLLDNGNVLVVGGLGAAGSNFSSEYFTEYNFSAAMKPVISTVNYLGSFPVRLGAGTVYPITGTGFKGLNDYPRAYMQFVGTGGSDSMLDCSTTLYPMSAVQWQGADTAISFATPSGLPSGYYRLTVRACGVPSDAKLVYYDPSQIPYLVTNTNDSGAGSLRQCIINANAAGRPVTIAFNIPASDPGYISDSGAHYWRIAPATELPAIVNSGVIIDGTTQAIFAGNTNSFGPEIELRGGSFNGLTLQAANCTVRGLVINNFDIGINIAGDGTGIYGNYIGCDALRVRHSL